MNAINGNNILVYRNGSVIAATRTHEIQTSSEVIEISSATDSIWKHYIAGRKEWTVSVNYLVMAGDETTVASRLREMLNIGTQYILRICERTEGTTTGLSGTAILRACVITATRGSLVQGSFTFVGTGPLA